jgi:thiamine biosynthesis lipoprotein
VSIDLSAIAKGYAVDCVANDLEQSGFKNYMIEVGGEIRCKGKKAMFEDWIIVIENPFYSASQTGSLRQIPLKNCGLATSGSYRQKKIIDGKSTSHFIDPRTGLPTDIDSDVDSDSREILVSVSVIANCCMLADAWATALFVVGAEKGLQLAETNGLAALFLLKRGETIHKVVTPSFP